jgi:hypothetical protein
MTPLPIIAVASLVLGHAKREWQRQCKKHGEKDHLIHGQRFGRFRCGHAAYRSGDTSEQDGITANMTVAPSMNKMPSGTRSARREARSARLSEVKEKPQKVMALA